MKKILTFLMAFLMILSLGWLAEAADPAMNRKLGYFDNTRTVLLLPARYSGSEYAASILNREMKDIFKYPYYRTLDTSDYAGMAVSPSSLPEIAEKTGADIVILPTLQWRQWVFHRYFFDDGDAIVETRAIVDIYSYKKTEGIVRQDRGTYFDTEDEGFVRTVYIMDDLMKKVYKTFPYRRVPTDVSKSLTGETSDNTPKAVMKN
ncbi:hypothetical protein [Dialister sp.]|uniref:hypothetical protein n=1 Tax=Dialister sp. TaxID=1955814 RepID=UPI002E801A82|nr:hypothetical protein [Dialister sp.]MEE3452635.1 hypothetical protein [Dialister sp.]